MSNDRDDLADNPAYEALLNESLARQLRVASAAVDWRARALAAESRAERAEALLSRVLYAAGRPEEWLARIDAHLSGKAKE